MPIWIGIGTYLSILVITPKQYKCKSNANLDWLSPECRYRHLPSGWHFETEVFPLGSSPSRAHSFRAVGLANPCNPAPWMLRSRSWKMFELLTDFDPNAIPVKSQKLITSSYTTKENTAILLE